MKIKKASDPVAMEARNPPDGSGSGAGGDS
jgi:hypothetical protein